jgi:uncharacterized protein
VANEVDIRQFEDASAGPPVRGFLHTPSEASGNALIITHGAGANCQAPLLRSLADAFSSAGYLVLRCDLPFRQKRPHGPPSPATAEQDQAGLLRAVEVLRRQASGQVFLGGHSYGGRQASMLLAKNPDAAAGLLLLSYPLHPPRKPEQLRTAHLPELRTPALFVHGERDPFGSITEMQSALKLIPARPHLQIVERAGHELIKPGAPGVLPQQILESFRAFFTV